MTANAEPTHYTAAQVAAATGVSGSGFVTHVDTVPIEHCAIDKPDSSIKRTDNGMILEGMACLYGKPHAYKGCVDVFAKGCFNRSLATKARVQFYIDHKHNENPLGDSDSNLELVESDLGLGFRLTLTEDSLRRLDGRKQISVCYTEIDVEEVIMEGVKVRLIKSASLLEISGCHKGAVPKTYSVVRNGGKCWQKRA